MKIEIWSDVMCPFCYIGKRNFEAALAKFPDRDDIEVEWKSFQLDPAMPEVPRYQENMYQFVAARKGISYDQSVAMHEQVARMAENAGLDYQFDKMLVTNSLKAHRIIQMAKTKGLGEKAEEQLFYAYFTEGKNLSDDAVLTELGISIGLTATEVKEALTNPVFQHQVEADGAEASRLGAKGVPFFVIDRKYAIAGAQPGTEILKVLQTAYTEWKKDNPGPIHVRQGDTCAPGNDCTN
ncbi:DsbA family oxidoreductase [Mucilaginibacter sp. Mucisp84]|uniref:DsbA family oxidoreductase n=1 Tax=Mucilaginibacter sp. Mucisp84 TaxID=3243058 RepID=UPI0039A518E2